MRQAIENFAEQFEFRPEIKNETQLNPVRNFGRTLEFSSQLKDSHPAVGQKDISNGIKRAAWVIVCGMGGSHLAADLINEWSPGLDIWVWKDYGLPPLPPEVLGESFVIASSYSGNTEETIDAYLTAKGLGAMVAVIATGGTLLGLAKKDGVPYVELPQTGIQPRLALGYSVRALLALLGETAVLDETSALAGILKPKSLEAAGRDLAKKLAGYVPVVYASRHNWPLAYNWKIKLNETGKIPAFANFLPELNHNEMNGFDVQLGNKPLTQNFAFVFLRDPADDPRILKRMAVLQELYEKRRLPVWVVDLPKVSLWEKIFSNLILADWTAFYTAEQYKLEAEQVPMVEEFKRMVGGM